MTQREPEQLQQETDQPESEPPPPELSRLDAETPTQEAQALYQRSVAAARGGKNVLAAKLLHQALKLDPQYEHAWLWLSSVERDPRARAACLRAALAINPENRHAQRGLAWLMQQQAQPQLRRHRLTSGVPIVTHDPWWSAYRSVQTIWKAALRTLLLIPAVLLLATLSIRAVIHVQPLPDFNPQEVLAQTISAAPAPTIETPPVTTATRRATVLAYFREVDRERRALQRAVREYQDVTAGGRSTEEQLAATTELREQVRQSHAVLAGLEAPAEMAAAHDYYLAGLELEQAAYDYLLDFYQTDDVALANQAAATLQQARSHIAAARATWEQFMQQRHLRPEAAGAQ